MQLERCVPRPSLQKKRKRAAFAVTALAIGVLAAMLGGKAGQHFMMPGKLSSPHAGLTNCSACHSGARSNQVDLLHRLFTTVEPRQNSNLCLSCHVMGSEPFAPHGQPVEDLKQFTEKLRRNSKSTAPETLLQRIALPAAVSQNVRTEIQCATCHKEHRGVFADLKTISNERCQSCHVSRFGSFASSHPQFEKFPYSRRPRIKFDHQSHMAKHFPDAVKAAVATQVAPESCTDCHQPGVRRRYMEVKSFATMCSGCHNGDIAGTTRVSGPKGIDVITVPGLDLATLNERGIDIGSWPKASEAALTPFMRLLLESRQEPLVSDVAGLNLLELRKASDLELASVARLAWAVKRLFSQLQTTNPADKMLGGANAQSGDVSRLAALTGAMSHDVVMSGSREWFPNLEEDLQRHDRGEATRDFKPPDSKPAIAAPVPVPNPAADSKADILAPANKASAPASGAPGLANTDIRSPNDKADILAPANKVATPALGTPAPENKADILAPSDKADILAPDGKADILAPAQKAGTPPPGVSASDGKADILGPADILAPSKADVAVPGKALVDSVPPQTNAEAKQSPDAKAAPFDPEVWAQSGGWYRQDFAIRYRPAGHADQFLRTWLDIAGSAYGTALRDQMAPVFDMLVSNDSVGRCTKCHSVDDQAGARSVNWRPFDPNTIYGRFTKFSHKPHIEIVTTQTQTCVTCHELRQSESQFLKTYETGDPFNYSPNFKYLEKSGCAACHSQQTVWEGCSLCHGYHVPNPALSPAQPLLSGTIDAETSPLAPADARRDYSMALQQLARQGAAGLPATASPDLPQPAGSASVAAAIPAPPADAKSTNADPEEPTNVAGLYRRGRKRAIDGDFELAVQDFNAVIGRDPGNAAAFNDRCWVRALLDEAQDALKDCDMALRLQAAFPDASDSRGLVNLKLGRYKRAIDDFNTALLYNSRRASALYGRGIARRRSGDIAGARVDIAAAKAIQPTIGDEFASYGIR